ncbi:glycoside hydrolase family 2 sugar binding protein [Kribbella flavida DSM 17836]|uniref:Glycoside hydrolase family 2 sugar binding protein n=1 Tax=Kribbella flavida (strain DSM 17836 / JCM 10339 / NBRC 14399) TaxID=479435 RepID=D2PTT2_KRIFD|nr:glycoside hydrolase family 2 [Kribbella flavida]ADB33215.1 glycoside hydrolase family 2 sugar binding protein [Kribbella flavida DSM 17836]
MPTSMHDRHPRPLLARADWLDLSGEWQFAHDDTDVGLAEHWQSRTDVFERVITVPYPPESPASGIHDTGYHPVLWYRRTLPVTTPPPGRRTVLRFGAVDYRADIWVNGEHVANHEGGQTPFSADITDALTGNGEQVLVVRAWDDPHDLEQPRGKQDWQERPHVIWYERTSGIWQPVWLEEVPADHLETVLFTPTTTPGTVEVEVRLARRSSGPVKVSIQLSLDGRPLADDTWTVTGSLLRRRLTVQDSAIEAEPHLLLWSPEQPILCDATVTVEGQGGPDKVESYFGFRTVGTDERSFLLNGRPYYLRLALAQGYWPQSHLAAPGADALRAEVELIKQLGFNGVRIHQKAEDPRFLSWCDRLGVLVYADAAASYAYTGRSLARTTREWTEIVERDAGHPCIAGWVAFNESWGVAQVADSEQQRDAVRALYRLLKALDPSRPVIGNDGWEYVEGDLLGIHDYTHDPGMIHRRYADENLVRNTVATGRPGGKRLALGDQAPAVPVLLSEFGGFTHAPDDPTTWSGYGVTDSPEQLLERLATLLAAVHASTGLAGFCYTQLTDTGQERNGLLTEDRKPKADLDLIARIVTGPPR